MEWFVYAKSLHHERVKLVAFKRNLQQNLWIPVHNDDKLKSIITVEWRLERHHEQVALMSSL